MMVNNEHTVVKLLKRMRVPEMILVGLSFLYGLGLLVLIQHYALYLGFEDLDVIRVKPIVVGMEYVVYLAVPFVVVLFPLPFCCKLYKTVRGRCWMKSRRRVLGFLLVGSFVLYALLFLAFASGLGIMLHYFFPYIVGSAGGYLNIIKYFWSVYFNADCLGHWFGFLSISVGFVLCFVCRDKPRKFKRVCGNILMLLGIACNLFFFNRDVYMNISQSAAGGAPRAGIVTISNPSVQLRKGLGEYTVEHDEITMPCMMFHENEEYAYIASMPSRHEYLVGEMQSCMRIPRSSIAHFEPISFMRWCRNGQGRDPCAAYDNDPIYNLSAELRLVSSGDVSEPVFLKKSTKDEDPILFVFTDKVDRKIVSTNLVTDIAIADLTNIIVSIKFPHVACPWGMLTKDLISRDVDRHLVICGLPQFNTNRIVKIERFQLEANFMVVVPYPIDRELVTKGILRNRIVECPLRF